MTHCMLDLETWGTRPGCALRSIGAVAFDPNGGPILEPTFYQNVTCYMVPLSTDPTTAQWWSEQSPEARAALECDQITLQSAVQLFAEWWAHVGATSVWCHGASFDAPIYEAAAHAVGLGVPWAYNAVRDTRTLYMLADFDPKSVPFEGVEHNALADAINQATGVQLAASKLRHATGRIR